MSATLAAVAAFSAASWSPVVSSNRTWQFEDAYEVLVQWANDVGDVGIGFDDVEKDVQWVRIDSDRIAYKIGGHMLLVIEWDYDAELVGEDMVGTLTIHNWTAGSTR